MSRINLENSDSTAQSVSDRLLTLLKTRGPQQASDAGKVLGTTGEAARQQFVKLAKEGLVEAVAETRGVGRPVQLWHLTSAGNARFPDTHADLTVQLLRTVRDKLGEQALDVLIETREQENRINYKQAMIGAADLQERVARLTEIRCREGYMAEWRQEEDGTYLLVENHCPICAAATVCQGFCRAELSIFTEVLQAQVERAEHILAGSRRCAYRISLL
ncbi:MULTISPECIES: helix-turn-helix transcriptional regulator [Serratia]|uniref:Transcriptional regulator n=2 Tax=Serratia TaxID=613 RepID=A0AAW6X2P0_9GAMM|nr:MULTISPECIES: metalloregulator ArsR/SmtB family transcription factor [Serratia]AKL40277.1 transcriptional regulator [Serratia marcescens]AUY14081.1 transcriptional regulator [Serratia sp. SSNIH1]AWL67529.1 transcriptional regulator [Serratia marcescens]EGT0502208.1 transcriptional regulator [Serratia marcescens]EGT3593913.1 transcriptional regulator [Serratia marcescens]